MAAAAAAASAGVPGLSRQDLHTLRLYWNASRALFQQPGGVTVPDSAAAVMDWPVAMDVLGENFTFQDYVTLIRRSRSQLYWFPVEVEVPLILVYSLIMLFGVVSNGMICYVVLRKKKLRTVRNLLIVNLSVSDIIMSVFCMPFTLLKLLLKNWPLGEGLCRLVPWLQAVSVFSSTITIAAIALDRYQAIVYPASVKDRTKRVVTIGVIVGIWSVSAIVGMPLLLYSRVEYKELIKFVGYRICLEEWPSSLSRALYASTVMVLQFVIPILVLIVIHWRICTFLKYRIRTDPNTPQEMMRAVKDAKRHRKNTTLLMAIAVMFALCWFPLTLLNFLADFNYSLFMFHNFLLAFALAHIIAMISACLNPILYGWFNSNFRREFSQMVFFWRSTKEIPSADTAQNLPEERSHLVVAPQKLKQEGGRRVVYKKEMCYKAIQTEVQPAKLMRKGTESTSDYHDTPIACSSDEDLK